jgi:biopolymer transport protein ExbD
MAGKSRREDGEVMSDINVTPFVDIVLVLLIILMVTSVKIVKASIGVDLPSAAAAGASVETTVNIVIEAGGTTLLDGVAADDATIAAKIKAERAKNPKLQVAIAADKSVTYDKLMHAIDLVKTNGVKSFALDVKRKAE